MRLEAFLSVLGELVWVVRDVPLSRARAIGL